MSILNRMRIQRETAQQAATQSQPQNLSADVKAKIQQSAKVLQMHGVTGGQQAGYGGEIKQAQPKREHEPTQEM